MPGMDGNVAGSREESPALPALADTPEHLPPVGIERKTEERRDGAGDGAGCEDPGIIAAAYDDPDASLRTPRELAVEHVLLEQCVAHREQEEIHVEEIEKTWN